MKRAAIALRSFLTQTVDVEGAFLFAGTACLAVGSYLVNPIAPWFVVGGACLLVGVLLAAPRRAG